MSRPEGLEEALDQARAVADAVLYEGYLLYPYRASSSKNQARWQFGVLGPTGAAEAGIGEEPLMAVDCLLRAGTDATVTVYLRCLQLQRRTAEAVDGTSFRAVDEIAVDGSRWLTWDEAFGFEQRLPAQRLAALLTPAHLAVSVPGSHEVEDLHDRCGALAGRLVRVRRELGATLELRAAEVDGLVRLSLVLENTAPPQPHKSAAIAASFIGTHLLLQVDGGEFVSTSDPPEDARPAAAGCGQRRWWPVLAGPRDESRILLVSPIIVEDHAELAPESAGALFDSTEIDEILTLRVMTMTDAEKADARATDARAAEIIDRCDAMSPEQLQDLHGVLRSPHGTSAVGADLDDLFALPDELAWATPVDPENKPIFTADAPWWDPEADASVAPETDSVTIAGVRVSRGALVTVRPNRRADAQDFFYTGMVAKVSAVLSDVDGDTHVAVTLVDDPAAELHDWYGRYLYFAPDELVPLETDPAGDEQGDTTEGEPP